MDKRGKIIALATGTREEELTHADAGVRLVRKEFAEYFPQKEVFSLEDDLYPRLNDSGKLLSWPVKERYYDIGTPERVRIFEGYLNGDSM